VARVTNEPSVWDEVIRVPSVQLDFACVALVVIDLQYLTASREHGLFRRLREQGMSEAAEYAIGRIEDVVVPNVRRLLDGFREAGAPVFYARCVSLRGDGSDQTARHRAQGLVCSLDSKEAEILEEIAPRPADVVLAKTGSSVFNSTNLEHLLRNIGITTLAITGIWTNSCVEGTTRDAGDLDFGVVVPEDACGAVTPELHRHALDYLDDNFCHVAGTDEVLAALHAARPVAVGS
jgi:nicotinamidase-related amidase